MAVGRTRGPNSWTDGGAEMWNDGLSKREAAHHGQRKRRRYFGSSGCLHAQEIGGIDGTTNEGERHIRGNNFVLG
jgi:hypothetical protein